MITLGKCLAGRSDSASATQLRGRGTKHIQSLFFFCFPIKSAHAQWEKVFAIILYINNTDHQGSSISWAKLINGSLVQNNIMLC